MGEEEREIRMADQLPLQPHYYHGQPHFTTATFTTIDPARNQPIAHVCRADKPTLDAAIHAAQSALPAWSATPPSARARILLRAVRLLRDRNPDLARLETRDTGKPFSETSTVDVVTGADVLEFYAHHVAAGGLDGHTVSLRPDAAIYTTHSPLGVCAAIGAWNYPLQIALWKSAPCLAAGNCLVYKPSEFTPLHALPLAHIFAEAGLPPGVFNVVHGAGDVGAMLTAHPAIAKVSFTGQVATGRAVAAAAAKDMKRVVMELGGKSPCLVLPDADLDVAVDAAMMANFFSTGQVCTNGTRVFVPDSLLTAFHARLLDKMSHIRVGDPADPATNFGPLVSQIHRDKVLGYIHHGIHRDRATVLAGGLGIPTDLPPSAHPDGFWVRPTVFTHCTDDMLIARDEIFGPVMCILPYSDTPTSKCTAHADSRPWLAPLIQRANATPLGLAAGVFTRDLSLAHTIVARLDAGITWINTWGESPAEMPVGGWKMSGMGVENGREGLESWVRSKSTLVEMSGKMGTVFAKL